LTSACRLDKIIWQAYGAVAQLARVLDWQSRGREFESLQLHHVGAKFALLRFLFCGKGNIRPLPCSSFSAKSHGKSKGFACKRAPLFLCCLPTFRGCRLLRRLGVCICFVNITSERILRSAPLLLLLPTKLRFAGAPGNRQLCSVAPFLQKSRVRIG
jgi:hypothetical protein